MLYTSHALAAEHLNDRLRDAELDRQAALVRGVRRSAWTLFLGHLAGLIRRQLGTWGRGAGLGRLARPGKATA